MELSYSKLDASPLPFLHFIEVLKDMERTGWMRWFDRPESVSAHMWRLSIQVYLTAPAGVDPRRCMEIAMCHDIAESFAGDIPTYAPVSKAEKHKLEDFGIRYIESLLQIYNPERGQFIRAAWEEYENGNTPEATPEGRFVREADKFECMIQAHEYEQKSFGEKDLEEFQGQVKYIKSEEGKEVLQLLQEERQDHFQKRRERTPVIFIFATPGVNLKTQCDLLSKEFDFQHIYLDDILHERSSVETYLHAKFLKECLEEKVIPPVQLAVDSLEWKIKKGIKEGKMWSLVRGFPENINQLVEFKKKVQKTNYTLFLNDSSEELQGQTDIVNDLKVNGYFKEIRSDGSVTEVFSLLKEAVKEFTQHAEVEK